MLSIGACQSRSDPRSSPPAERDANDATRLAETDGHESLTSALKRTGGDLRRALELMELSLDVDDDGVVRGIVDPLMRGNLTDAEFARLAELPKLERLNLRGTRLTDHALESLARFPSLESLSIEDAKITDDGLRLLKGATRLRAIRFASVPATGIGLQHIDQPAKIEELSLTRCDVAPEAFALLGRFTNLRSLSFFMSENARIDDAAAGGIAQCRRLESLDLNYTQLGRLTSRGLATLTQLPKLAELQLGRIRLSEADVEGLIGMLELKTLSVSDLAITEAMLKRLRADDIEVSHGQLRDYRREDDVLRYRGNDFAIDPEESEMRVYLHPEQPGMQIQVDIRCTDQNVPEFVRPAHLEGPPIDFAGAIEDLPGTTLRADFDEKKMFPILPDNPANIYDGMHAVPNHHSLKVRERREDWFFIEWTCEAKDSLQATGIPVYVKGKIRLQSITVWKKGTLTIAEARETAVKSFPADALGDPVLRAGNEQTFVDFPFRPAMK